MAPQVAGERPSQEESPRQQPSITNNITTTPLTTTTIRIIRIRIIPAPLPLVLRDAKVSDHEDGEGEEDGHIDGVGEQYKGQSCQWSYW